MDLPTGNRLSVSGVCLCILGPRSSFLTTERAQCSIDGTLKTHTFAQLETAGESSPNCYAEGRARRLGWETSMQRYRCLAR